MGGKLSARHGLMVGDMQPAYSQLTILSDNWPASSSMLNSFGKIVQIFN